MLSRLERFKKEVVGYNEDIIDFAPVIVRHGDFQIKRGVEALLLSVNNLLMTPRGTYTFDPEYGCNIYKLVFAQNDEDTEEDIKAELNYVLPKYDDRVTLEGVRVTRKLKEISVDILLGTPSGIANLSVIYNKELYLKLLTQE